MVSSGKIFKLIFTLPLGLAFFSYAQSSPANIDPKPYIMAGTLAPRVEWAALIINDDATDGCTGIVLSADYVLTAEHCISDPTIKNITVHYSSDNKNIPEKNGVTVDMQHIYKTNGRENPTLLKGMDLVILKVSKPHKLKTYAPLQYDYIAKEGVPAVVYGYGEHDNVQSLHAKDKPLYQAKMNIEGQSASKIFVNAGDGSTNPGDSGGPLLVGGKVVGILWGGDKNPTPQSKSVYNAFNHPLFGSLKPWFEAVLNMK